MSQIKRYVNYMYFGNLMFIFYLIDALKCVLNDLTHDNFNFGKEEGEKERERLQAVGESRN